MTADWRTAVESTLIAAAAGLLGLLVGRFWDRISESATWRRDTRVRCYEELAGTYYLLREAIRILSSLDPATAESDLAVGHVLELGAQWERNIVAVWLHGSESVTGAVKELDNQVNRLFLEARSTKLTWSEWRYRRAEAEAALEGPISAIRREFRLPEFPIRLRLDPALTSGAENSRANVDGN
jgi:hypothetical protein